MKSKLIRGVWWIASLGILLAGCQSLPAVGEKQDVLFQYSTLGSLMEGVYDGEMTFAELKQHGDFGLGTFNALDGEMIEVDHQVYQVRADGRAYAVDDGMKTPFSVVTYFEADQTTIIDQRMDLDELKSYVDDLLPTENIHYAIRLSGTFEYVKTRSVPAQQTPYPRLLDVLAEQPTFEFQHVEGVIVGFRLPDYVDGANATGYHFHFITDERDAGGHVIECRPQHVTLEIDYTHEWYTVLPQDEAFYDVVMTDDEYQ